MYSHIGSETASNYRRGSSSREYWQCANARSGNALEVKTVYMIVKSYYKSTRRCRTAFIIQAPTNFVPAVAVKRGEQVLFVLIGRKGYVGCKLSLKLNSGAQLLLGFLILTYLSSWEVCGTLSVKIKFDDIKDTKLRRQQTIFYWRWGTKVWGANRIRDPSSPYPDRWVLNLGYNYIFYISWF
jgi:hypothetical protein